MKCSVLLARAQNPINSSFAVHLMRKMHPWFGSSSKQCSGRIEHYSDWMVLGFQCHVTFVPSMFLK